MLIRLPIAAALLMAISCGSADVPGLFGEPKGNGPRDASDGADARASGGRSGSGGDSGSPGGNASSDGGSNGSDGGRNTAGGRPSRDGGAGNGASSSGGDSTDGGTGGAPNDGGTASGGLNGAGGACEPKSWCRDRDGDGYGDPDVVKTACVSPGTEWTAQCNDCRDDNALVHPEAECRKEGYALSDGITLSFDYDCDGHETECADFVKASPDGCGTVGPLSCAGGGYLPNPDRKAGEDLNAYCGSTAYRNCVSVALPCVAQLATKPAILCH